MSRRRSGDQEAVSRRRSGDQEVVLVSVQDSSCCCVNPIMTEYKLVVVGGRYFMYYLCYGLKRRVALCPSNFASGRD